MSAPEKATKPKRATKPKPARPTPEPEADELAMHGQKTVVWQQAEGAPWEVIFDGSQNWGGTRPMTHAEAWTLALQGFRAREYNRGRKCVRDSRDEGGAS
jgi:hypothetical protein